MALDHYAEGYSESPRANFAEEFGTGVAVTVVEGERFTPELKATLIQSSRVASQQRTSCIAPLEPEVGALDEAAPTLTEIDADRSWVADSPPPSQSYDALVDDWHHLGELADRCDGVIADR